MGLLEGIRKGDLKAGSRTLAKWVPGYDYRRKETRRRTDAALRDKLARTLKQAKGTLDGVGRLAYEDERRDVVKRIEEVTQALDLGQLEIQQAESGVMPFFSKDDVSEQNLIALLEYDAKLLEEAAVLEEAAKLVQNAVMEGRTKDIERELLKLKQAVSEFRAAFKDRRDYLTGLSA